LSERRSIIFIGMPCYGTVAPEVLEDFARFTFNCGRRMPEYDFKLGIRTKSEQFRARNVIVDGAVETNADYLLMLDDDMIIDINRNQGPAGAGYDFLPRLLAHDKDIIGALYYQRAGECRPVLMKEVGSGGYRFLRDDEITGGLQQVDVAGGGCLLVKMRVFDKVKPPYFEPEFKFGTDIQLCRKAKDLGFEIWADTSIELGHVRDERVIVTSKNRHQFVGDRMTGEGRRYIQTEVFDDVIQDVEEWTGFGRHEFDEKGQYFHSYIGKQNNLEADAEMYSRFPKERVARQVWFNSVFPHKRSMTEFILGTVKHDQPRDILDFGCGIGIPAFFFATKGHRVVARDLPDTGTYQFLQWRAQKHNVAIEFNPANEPWLDRQYDVIVAMDVLEHFEDWRSVLAELAARLKPGGVLFANNAILDDDTHPEHYPLKPKDFLKECVNLGLMPGNQFAYVKQS
jgi:SAM-dependent methyltransferase